MRMNKKIFAVFFAMFLPFSKSYASSPLDKYKWKNRIIVLYSSSKKNKSYIEQQKILKAASIDISERDIIQIHIIANHGIYFQGSKNTSQLYRQLIKQLRLGSTPFTFLLIGKDGGIKLESVIPVSIAKINETIDAMPMRQLEMQRKQP